MTGQKGYELTFWGDFSESSDGIADLRQILNRIEMIISGRWYLGFGVLVVYPVPLFKGAASGAALGAPTAETGGTGSITHWQGV